MFPRLQQQVRVHKLIGPKLVVFVIENGFQLGGSGRLIDLIIDGEQFSCRKLRLIVATVSLDLPAWNSSCVATTIGNSSSGSVKITAIGCNCVRISMGVGIGGVNDISRIHLPQADAAGEWRGDIAIDELQFRVIDLRLIGAHLAIELIDG